MIYQILLLSILFIFLYSFSNKLIKYLIYSPYHLYIAFNLTTLILTILYYYFYNNKFDLFRLEYKTTSEEFFNLIKFHLIHLNAFVFGGLVIHSFTSLQTRKTYLLRKFPLSIVFKIDNYKKLLNAAILSAVLVLILYLMFSGKGIFIREDYIPKGDSKALTLLAKLFSLISVFLFGLVYKQNKYVSYFCFVLIILLNVSTGSRFTFVLLIAYILLLYNGARKTMMNNFIFLLNLVLAFFFLAYIIQLRKQDTHGLIPYLGYVFESFDAIVDYFLFNVYYMFIFGNFVTIDTVDRGLSSWETIKISLNPMPGSMVGWYDFASTLRINKFCPYSSHGEVFTIGASFTMFFYFVIGMLITYLDISFRKFMAKKNFIAAFVILLFVGLHLIYGFEYNLRSSLRYLYYIIFVLLAIWSFKQLIKPSRPSKLPLKNENE